MILLVDGVVASRQILRAIWTLALLCSMSSAQQRPYAGVLGGIATLSADARSVIAASGSSASAYKPSNGGVVNAFGGFHVNDFLSIQGNYTWNHNALELFAIK